MARALDVGMLGLMIPMVESAERREGVDIGSTVDVPPALPTDWDPLAATL
jgi:2-keto-3-deoxy-L-rhamnonate aldolase RhmA